MKSLPPILNREQIYFVASPIETIEGVVFAHEILLRYKHFSGAEALLRVVRHLELQAELDLDVLALLEETLRGEELHGSWNLNLFSHSLYNSHLIATLEQFPTRLGISLDELILDLIDLEKQREVNQFGDVMTALKERGIRFALPADDEYRFLLSKLPVDILKLDINKTPDPEEWRRWKGFAFRNDLKIIAQRVETEEQFKELQKLQVDYVQGYYIGKPKKLSLFEVQSY
ncbi:EAL domain-containing protein [Dongshaea marina]|uniref:EAL domain-containing protein n=1 Tax=Dongshaea marina TaxID=2047966 RepID=UPI000D3E4169|nr:EAL domain-containing protein [Dongshaea marina]